MKGPGQRGFHICDILDLNNPSDAKSTQNNNNNHSTNNNNHQNSTNSTYPTQTSSPITRDESLTNLNESIASTASSGLNSSLTSVPTAIPPPPPPPYQFTPNLSSAIYSELGHHYHSIFPSTAAATKSWLKDHEHYGKYSAFFYS